MIYGLYEIIGVKKNASQEEIKEAYKQKAKIFHPDKGGNTEDFRKLHDAYKILSDPDERVKYDRGDFAAIDPNSPQEIALKILIDLFNLEIDNAVKFQDCDFVSSVKKKLTMATLQLSDSTFSCEQRIKEFSKMEKKIKVKKDCQMGFISVMIKQKIQDEQDRKDSLKKQIIIFEDAKKMMNDIEWKDSMENDFVKHLSESNFSQIFKVNLEGESV